MSVSSNSSKSSQTLDCQKNSWYFKEIQNMMHGFGDTPNPIPESVRLIEEIVHQQVICLLKLACEIATKRHSKQIGLEEFLFLLRKDKMKLCRLLRHFSLKDMRNNISDNQWTEDSSKNNLDIDEAVSNLNAGCTMDFDEEELLNALITEQKTNQKLDFFFETTKPSDSNANFSQSQKSQTSNKATVFPQSTKRLKLCSEFLTSIDQTGELGCCLQEDQFFDELKHTRMMRLERITRFMSEEEYLNFYKARQASFANHSQPNKFRDWLYSTNNELIVSQWPIKINSIAIEILQYFAYETVAVLVDLALLVKQDKQKRLSSDPVSGLISINAHNSAFPLLNTDGNLNSSNLNSTLNNQMGKNMDYLQQQNRNTLPSPFFFESKNYSNNDCPFFSIKPQEIREVVLRYINSNPRGTLSSVLLFGIEQWDQPSFTKSRVMCL